MPLEFRGVAIMDPPKRRVRFAGYPAPDRAGLIIICEVSVAALLALARENDLSEDDLMRVFELHKAAISAAASAQFDGGNIRPTVEAKDLAALLT